MIQAYFIRHCEACGQEAEAPLTEKGFMQAEALATQLKDTGIKRIIASTFKRAIQSAVPLSQTLEIKVETDERLRERTLGTIIDGDWMKALARTYEEPELRFPEGESTIEAAARARQAISEVLTAGTYPVAFITHGNLLSLIARSFHPELGFEFWKALSNPDIFELHNENNSTRFERKIL